jgi:hypothetical protein
MTNTAEPKPFHSTPMPTENQAPAPPGGPDGSQIGNFRFVALTNHEQTPMCATLVEVLSLAKKALEDAPQLPLKEMRVKSSLFGLAILTFTAEMTCEIVRLQARAMIGSLPGVALHD